ncbi:MAG TPA: tetratricopeptide repeat protein, partial [Tepidisphaeraceae bacterium]|nr:tetratricopeptide repeat protein [Tepidisphaeraceae bacterium]
MGQPADMVMDPSAVARSRAAEGERLLALGRFEEAVSCYGEAAQLQPSVADYPYKVAMCAWHTRQVDLVEPNLHRALQLQPDQPILHEALGEWYLTTGKLDAALAHATQALRLAPQSPDYAVSYAMVLHTAGRSDAAWEIARKLLDGGFMSCRLALLHAQLSAGRGQEAEALQSIERAFALNCQQGQTAALLFTAAELLDRLGRFDEAFERAAQANRLAAVPYDP